MTKDPAFLLYSKDWIEGTAEMSPYEKGIYIDLLCFQHQRNGLPKEEDRLARLVGVEVGSFKEVWGYLSTKFSEVEGKLFNKKLLGVSKDRANYGEMRFIIGVFGQVLKHSKLTEKQKDIVKKKFNYKDWIDTPKQELKQELSKYLAVPLGTHGDGNGNEDYNIIRWEDFISGFNEITKKNFKGNDKIRGQLSARVKDGYKLEQILTATQNCFSDPFHKENPKYLTPEFILRADKLDKYLNYSKPNPKQVYFHD